MSLTLADRARLDALFGKAVAFADPHNVLCERCHRGCLLYDGRTVSESTRHNDGTRTVRAWHLRCYRPRAMSP